MADTTTAARGGTGAIPDPDCASQQPTLLLLHGLGTTGATWSRMRPVIARGLARDRPGGAGSIRYPDLAGHGAEPPDPPYGYSRHAARLVAGMEPGTELIVVGHSMGAMVGLALAAGDFGVRVRGVVGFSVRLTFTAEDELRMRKLGGQPVRWFESRDDALDRYLLVAGLAGLVDRDDPIASSGVVTDGGRSRLAADPRIHLGVGAAAGPLARAITAPLRLLAGGADPMVSIDDMRRLDPDAVLLDGLGHNPHVEAPERLWAAIGPIVAAMASPPRSPSP